jgi:predicted N-acetyltransferase YhbS
MTPSPLALTLRAVQPADFEMLFALRSAALHDSLARLGRLNPERSRARFQASFSPNFMRHILLAEQAVGFVTVRPDNDALLLEHLFVRPGQQGQGIGAAVLGIVLAEARAAQLDLRVAALRGSDANRFYVRHGFVQADESEWDIHYVYRQAPALGR